MSWECKQLAAGDVLRCHICNEEADASLSATDEYIPSFDDVVLLAKDAASWGDNAL